MSICFLFKSLGTEEGFVMLTLYHFLNCDWSVRLVILPGIMLYR